MNPEKNEDSAENGKKETIPQLFGRNVRKYRKIARLTQEQLSEKLGITQKHLSIVETGTQFASAGLIQKISEELQVSPGDLFGGTSDEIKKEIGNMRNDLMTMMMSELKRQSSILSDEIQKLRAELNSKNTGNQNFGAFEPFGI